MGEEVVALRNNYYVGNFAKVFEEAKGMIDLDSKNAVLRDVYIQRANVALGKLPEVYKSVSKSAPIALQAVKLWATFKASTDENRDAVFGTLSEWMGDASMASDPVLRLVAAEIWFESHNNKDALNLAFNGETLELYVCPLFLLSSRFVCITHLAFHVLIHLVL